MQHWRNDYRQASPSSQALTGYYLPARPHEVGDEGGGARAAEAGRGVPAGTGAEGDAAHAVRRRALGPTMPPVVMSRRSMLVARRGGQAVERGVDGAQVVAGQAIGQRDQPGPLRRPPRWSRRSATSDRPGRPAPGSPSPRCRPRRAYRGVPPAGAGSRPASRCWYAGSAKSLLTPPPLPGHVVSPRQAVHPVSSRRVPPTASTRGSEAGIADDAIGVQVRDGEVGARRRPRRRWRPRP